MVLSSVSAGIDLPKTTDVSRVSQATDINSTAQNTLVTVESIKRVLKSLEPSEMQLFERDLRSYGRTGERSAFLDHILEIAAGELRDTARTAA